MENDTPWQAMEMHPERKALLERLEALRLEYIALFTRRDAMVSYERGDLYCRYVRLVGREKYENFRLSVEVRALKLKAELAQAALNRNQLPRLSEIEAEVAERLKVLYAELERQAEGIRAAEKARAIPEYAMEELRSIYRTLVRRLHPDLHPDLGEDSRDLFAKAVAAYRTCDIDVLRQIVKRLDMEGGMGGVVGLDESPEEAAARLQRDIGGLKRQIASLRAAFPFCLEANMLDPGWVAEQRQAIGQERHRLLAQKKIYEERIELLTAT